jgi:tetratricopeptide (TPR) repeat protein
MKKARRRIDVNLEELDRVLDGARQAPLSESDHDKLKDALHALAEMLVRPRNTEKTSEVLEKPEDPETGKQPDNNTPPPPGHGRNGAEAFGGARKVDIKHQKLTHGDRCPECGKGNVYGQKEPKMLVRIIGQAPLAATVYSLERLRCGACGQVFTAQEPEGVGPQKYDETAAAMIAQLKYGAGTPFYRLEQLESQLGIPLPAATQWEIVEEAAQLIKPARDELIRQAAQGTVVHNDDTSMRVLMLKRDPKDERTGVFTSGIAQAYSGLADTYALLGDWQYAVMTPKEAFPKAKAAAIQALELDSTLGEAHNSLAFVLDAFDWNLDAAGKEFRRAIELNPGYATAHHWYAWHLSLLGRFDKAIEEMRKAENLDPLSLIINADLAEILVLARSYDESIRQSRKTIEMDPNFALAHNQLAQAYIQKQMYEEAVAEMQKAVKLSGDSPTCIANLARAYVASGKRSEAVKLLSDLKKRSNPSLSYSSEIAVIYVALGDRDQAMNWLEKPTKSDSTRASCCVQASIPSAPTRASKTFCAALAYPGETICVPRAVTKASGSTGST